MERKDNIYRTKKLIGSTWNMLMESLSKCPICEGENFSDFLACTDYTVSKKEFKIVSCDQCQFRFTNPRPGKDEIGKYYESEEYISHSNTSKGFINYLYQTVRKYTLIKKLQLINRQNIPVGVAPSLLDSRPLFCTIVKEVKTLWLVDRKDRRVF